MAYGAQVVIVAAFLLNAAPQWAVRSATARTRPPIVVRSHRSSDLHAGVALDLVADSNVVVVANADAALRTRAHFVDIVLEATKRLELAFEDHDVVAQHADRIAATDVAIHDDTTRNGAELTGAEHLANLGKAHDLLLHLRCQHAREHLLQIVDRFVDDAVVPDIDARFLDHVASGAVGAHVEADDPRIRSLCQRHVGLGDTADPARNDLYCNLIRGQLGQRVAQRLDTALHVGLEYNLHRRRLVIAHLRQHVLELRGPLLRKLRIAELALAIQRDLAGLALAFDHEQLIARIRRTRETEHDDGQRRAGFRDRLPGFVEHRTHTAEFLPRDDRIAGLQGAALDEHRSDRTASLLHAGLHNDTGGRAGVSGLELEHVRLQENRIEQLIDALARTGGYVHEQRIAAPLFGQHVVLREIVAHAIRVRFALVDLVDRNDDRHVRGARVLNRLDRLR